MRTVIMAAAILLAAPAAAAQAPQNEPRVGEVYEIRWSVETSGEGSDGSSSSSQSRSALVERVVALRADGVELEYDLPPAASEDDRAREWHFPTRVLKPAAGPMTLLNGPELEARLARWLAAAGWTREICGRWIFTWNAFHIDCDPQSVLRDLERLELTPGNPVDGALIEDPAALGPAPLRRAAAGPEGSTFIALLSIHPEHVRREQAESARIVAEMTRPNPDSDELIRERETVDASGTIRITLDADAAGRAWRRTRFTDVQIRMRNGESERQTMTDVTERRQVSAPAD